MSDDVAVAVFTDGRVECITATMRSFAEQVTGTFGRRIVFDDSGDRTYTQWLADQWPDWAVIDGPRHGFCGNIARAWALLGAGPERWVFHLEDDFTFNRPVDVDRMAAVLAALPDLVQMALVRNPVNDAELAAGGVIEAARARGVTFQHRSYLGCWWLEHRGFFTTNPSVYSTGLCRQGWPVERECEGKFGLRVLEDPAARFAYWGEGDPWVEHIGHERVGTGY